MNRIESLLILAATLAFPGGAQAPTFKRVPAPYTSPSSGSDVYLAYCASCHGPKGQGNGPVATHLKVAVSDLTLLAKHNKGVFPEARVAQIIRGEVGTRTHGDSEMPSDDVVGEKPAE